MLELASLLRGRDRAPRSKSRSGFTLIELIVVIVIILILVVVLVVALLLGRERAKKSATIDLINSIKSGMEKWRHEEGRAAGSFPSSGKNPNTGAGIYEGNRRLYAALIGEPKRLGRAPYMDISNSRIGYLSASGDISISEGDGDPVFIDGWGEPIVYWEWASLASRASGGRSDIPGEGTSTTVTVPSYAKNTGSFDFYSKGRDKKWATDDDIDVNVEERPAPIKP